MTVMECRILLLVANARSGAGLIERGPDSLFLPVVETSLPGFCALVLVGKRVWQGVLQWSCYKAGSTCTVGVHGGETTPCWVIDS